MEQDYEIGQEYWMPGLTAEDSVKRVKVVALYPRCIIVEDKRGIKIGLNRQSAFLDLRTKKIVTQNKGISCDIDAIARLANQGYDATYIADKLYYNKPQVVNVMNNLKREGVIQ